MKICVTKEDIEQGHPQDPNACPIGRAVQRAGLKDYCVTASAIVVADQSQHPAALLLPESVQNWIADFDRAKPVSPITFELGLPVPAVCRCARFHGPRHSGCPQREKHAPAQGRVRCPMQAAAKA
jgi:hypothetical protein